MIASERLAACYFATEENFDACEKADMTIAPKPPGNGEILFVNNLKPGTTYYFAAKAIGADGMASEFDIGAYFICQ